MASPIKKRRVEPLPTTQAQSVLALGGIPMIGSAKPKPSPPTADANEKGKDQDKETEKEARLPSEKELGMTAFLDKDRPGFVAIFKQRYVDFIVREVNLDGDVVRLKDVKTLPKEDRDEEERLRRTFATAESNAVFEELLGADAAKTFLEYARLPEGDPRRAEKLTLRGPFTSNKEMRTKVHLAIKDHFKDLFAETKKADGSDEQVFVISYAQKRHRAHFSDWPKGKPDYVKFTLFKENKDTNNVIDLLCKLLRVTPKLFGTAGIKDKRAVTSQQVTAYRIPAQRLVDLNPRLYGVKLGNFSYTSEPLKLGSLSGNHFTITLRNILSSEEVLRDAAEKVKTHGFINYFGTQRFGTGTIATHEIGRLLLQGKWTDAIDLLLRPRPFEEPQSTEAREYFMATGDIGGTIGRMPKKHVIERNLLFAMKKHGKSLNALEELSYNVRLLYVHAYQSFIFNVSASRRIESVEHLNPVVGDLVFNSGTNQYEHVTAETLTKYSLDDVYLPLPGFDVKYPNNDLGAWIKDFMRKDGVNPDDMKRPQRVFSLPGGYRKLVAKPQSFEYRIVKYTDYTIPLATTDLDVLLFSTFSYRGLPGFVLVNSLLQEIQGKQLPIPPPGADLLLGMVVEMKLESSTYATMAIRELTKNETGMLYQRHIQKTVVDKDGKESPAEKPVEEDDAEEEAVFIEAGGYPIEELGEVEPQ